MKQQQQQPPLNCCMNSTLTYTTVSGMERQWRKLSLLNLTIMKLIECIRRTGTCQEKRLAAAVPGIVGEDDGGKLFTPEEYEQYKKKVLPIRLQNRLYVSWRSPTGMDCKLVGPETPCFCTHRYKQHKTDFEVIPKERPISLPCRVSRCPCKSYHFVPLNGTQPIRCRCKHFADQHSPAPGFACNTCSKCSGFHSSFTCGCGQPTYAHETVVETKDERLAQGKPVGQDVPYAAMGGLTGFSSLAEGYMRLDDSGIGAPSAQFLESPVTNMDHPFLKAFQGPSSSMQAQSQLTDGGASAAMQVSCLRKPEEDDMAYFERQYQERVFLQSLNRDLLGSAVIPTWRSYFDHNRPR
ncbi:protein FAM221A isoform X3 [Hemicordylus capensis]|uniref:protein FAM221A isoform X3 n=1 Tax=Hemicordylus capensis TaxID=884348 RepID=UPI002303174D|nr:protein FAM221A isoform X3 [Hemicordylus capensis]